MRLLAAFVVLVLFGLFAFTCVRDASAAQVGAQVQARGFVVYQLTRETA